MSSLAADSPSSSDDFANFLEEELDATSDPSSDHEEAVVEKEESDDSDEDKDDSELKRVKRLRMELPESIESRQNFLSHGEPQELLESYSEKNICTHPGIYAGMCMKCGEKIDDEYGVAFGYIHKNLRLAPDEMSRLSEKGLKNMLRHWKLCLVLDLDHTVLNSARLQDITEEEGYLLDPNTLPGALKSSLKKLNSMPMMTKLRPYVDTFLKEASSLFEMYIYTMGERPYAIEMAKLLDPEDRYFSSRIIAKEDCTEKHQKGLNIVGKESAVLILDDTEAVWGEHKENLILMDRYHFFASSCKNFGSNHKSLSEQRCDESETDGALATVLKILQRIHSLFFDLGSTDDLEDRDVRQVLKTVRKEVLNGCKLVFSRVFPTNFPAKDHQLWKRAEQLGAICSTDLDPSVTHVVSTDSGTDKSRWALQEKKFLVNPDWIEASKYMWKRQPEEKFRVSQGKNK